MLPRAITSDEHTRIQRDGQWAEVLACIPLPATVYTARVNGAPASTDQLAQLTCDGGSGTLADVLPGMTVLIGSTAGAYDRGQARIRKSPTSTIFYIGTESEIDVADNDYLTVVDEFGLWQKRVKIDSGTIYMDEDVAYTSQNDDRLPVVVMGGPVVLELAGASVTAQFDATNSWVPGASGNTYAWDAPGADSIDDDTAAAVSIVYSAAGRYRVACTVTIDGVSNTRYEYVQVFDADNPPVTQFQVRSLSGSKAQGGHAFQMTLYAEAGLATVRDRAQVILFTRDHYGAEGQVSTGYATGRENILCAGWISGETIVWSPELSSVTFQVEGAHAWLGRITAYPQGLEDVTTAPALWTDYDTLTMTAYLWHVLTWRSTVAQAIDCIVEISTTRVIELSAAATSLWEQIAVTAGQRLLAPPCTDHLSRLFVLIDSQFRSDRSGVVEVMTLAAVDWRAPIQLTRNPVSQVGMVDLSGFAWDGTNATALFALSPGRVWKRYGRVQSVQALLLDDQAQANALAGLIAGQANNEYPSITIQLAGNNRMLDIAPDCYALLTLAATDTPRGVSFTGQRLIPRKISWAYDSASGGLLPTVDFEAESFAELSVTGDAPATEPVPPPEPPPTETCPTGYHWDSDLEACVPDGGGGVGDGNTVYVMTYNKLARTRNFLAGVPTWTDLTTITPDGNLTYFCLASFDPVNTAYAASVNKVYLITDLNTDTPTWTAIMALADFTATTGGQIITADAFDTLNSPITNANYLWVGASGHNSHIDIIGLVALLSVSVIDQDATLLGDFPLAGANGVGLGSPTVRRLVGKFDDDSYVYTCEKYNGSDTTWRKLHWSGSAFSTPVSHTFSSGAGLDMDTDYPTSNTIHYFAKIESPGIAIYRSHDSGANWTLVLTATISGAIQANSAYQNRIFINIATQDETDVLVAFGAGSTSSTVQFYRTTNDGVNWTNVYNLTTVVGGGVVGCGRWPYDPNKIFFLADSIYYSADGLATAPQNKIGNWVSVLGAFPGSVQNAPGPVNIVPVWIAT